jgi:hypothetical protein
MVDAARAALARLPHVATFPVVDMLRRTRQIKIVAAASAARPGYFPMTRTLDRAELDAESNVQ